LGNLEIVPIRGNVPTRLEKLVTDNLDGVVLAAAGLRRLSIKPPHLLELPTDRFVPAPAQGALAIQTRTNSEAENLVRAIDHQPTHIAVRAERSFLKAINAGCHTPVGALATVDGDSISLHAQLFDDPGLRCVEAVGTGTDPEAIGQKLAKDLLLELGKTT
jgi:hydroxymethylbilane synthase